MLLQVASHGHDATDDGAGSGFAFVFKGVLKGHMPNEVVGCFIRLPVHGPRATLSPHLQEMLDSFRLKQALLVGAYLPSYGHIARPMF